MDRNTPVMHLPVASEANGAVKIRAEVTFPVAPWTATFAMTLFLAAPGLCLL